MIKNCSPQNSQYIVLSQMLLILFFKNENVKSKDFLYTSKALEPVHPSTLAHFAWAARHTGKHCGKIKSIVIRRKQKVISCHTEEWRKRGGKAELGCYLELTPSQSQGRGRRREWCVCPSPSKNRGYGVI